MSTTVRIQQIIGEHGVEGRPFHDQTLAVKGEQGRFEVVHGFRPLRLAQQLQNRPRPVHTATLHKRGLGGCRADGDALYLGANACFPGKDAMQTDHVLIHKERTKSCPAARASACRFSTSSTIDVSCAAAG